MIEDLMKLKKQIDTMIETYKDLHPDEEMVIDDIGQMYNPTDIMGEEHEKQRQKASKLSEGSPSLCVYGDS